MLKQNILIGITISSLVMLSACVSERSYVGSERAVAERTFDNVEAARTRISLGLNYLRRGDNSQAKYNLERARSFAPNSAEVYSALAYYYQSVDEIKQADEHYRLAIQKDNNYADAYNNYGAFLCQLQRYDEAEKLLLQAINRPGYIRVAESYENLAHCHLEQGQFEKARGYLENSISHNPNRISSAVMMAGLSYAMGRVPEAKQQLTRIQRMGRVSARTVLLSYLIARKTGDRDTQNNAEQLLLTLYSDTPETLLLLQNRLEQSEFELLRERYKDSLMANIVLPEAAQQQIEPPAPVANPKLKIVKRKSPDPAQTTKAPVKQEPAISEPAKQEPVKQEPVKQEPVKQEPVKQEPVKQEPAISEPAKQEPVKPEPVQQEPAISEPAKQEPVKQEPVQQEPVETEPVQQDPIEAEPVQQEPVAPEQLEPPEPSAMTAEEQNDSANGKQPNDVPFHLVQPGESLYTISVKHNIRLPSLMQWNQLTPESVIKTGQKIYLGEVSEALLHEQPEPVAEQVTASGPFHVVEAGETMFGISYRYNIRLQKFLSWNNLTEQSKLKVGQRVYIIDPANVDTTSVEP